MSAHGVGYTESDDRSLCSECGCFHEGLCSVGQPAPPKPARVEVPDVDFWRDSKARRDWAREERKKGWRKA